MNGIDMQASVHNLSQMDRHQSEAHRTPVVHQEGNADRAMREAAARIDMPVEPDEAEGKNADSQGRSKVFVRRRRRRREEEEEERRGRAEGRGFFVDFDA
jgi:hypothetical protein